MNITVKRVKQGNDSTLSEIYRDGRFLCYGLEDGLRAAKIKGATAIPAGRYRLQLNTYGGMNARYKRQFPALHRGMVELVDVPGFKYIYIHIGNNIGDTSGCLLVGLQYEQVDGDYELRKSRKAYLKLYEELVEVVEDSFIVISDEVMRDK